MPEQLTQAQADTLDAFVAYQSARDETLAVILSGSLARGWGNEHSDIDIIVPITDDAFAARQTNNTTAIYDESFATYEGGAIDAKFVTRRYLELAAQQASEPTRNAFCNARVAWTEDEAITGLVTSIGSFPEAGVDDRIARFTAQLETCKWYIGEADKRSNRYLAAWVATRASLFACRVILAHNRVLFPFHKWMLRALEDCDDQPAGLPQAIDAALISPNASTVHALCDLVLDHRDWPKAKSGWPAAFIHDTEQVWMRHEPAIEDI